VGENSDADQQYADENGHIILGAQQSGVFGPEIQVNQYQYGDKEEQIFTVVQSG
jgi:hypothetical protein